MTGDKTDPNDGDEVVYRTHFKFNSVYVIESLPPGAPKTGESLYDDVIFPKSRDLEDCFSKFLKVSSASGLFAALNEVLTNTRNANHKPILHFEAHGSSTGIELADGTHVTWHEIAASLTEINQASQFNLVVMAICCKGWFLTAALLPTDRAPVGLIIGPPENMTAADLLKSAERFYVALFEHIDFNMALEAMNNWRPYSTWPIRPASAEVLFCRVFRSYLNEVCSEESLRERENRLVADVVRAQSLDLVRSAALRLEIRSHISDFAWWYEHFRERFLMIDMFPHNRDRFGLTFQRCLPAAASSRVDD